MNKTQWTALGVVLALIGTTAVLLARVDSGERLGRPGVKLGPEPSFTVGGQIVRTQSVSLPAQVPGYTSKAEEITLIELNWLPKDTLYGRRSYHTEDGKSNMVSVVLMGTDRTSIHKPQFCLDAQGWHVEKTETPTVRMTRPYPYDLRVMKLTASKILHTEDGKPQKVSALYVYWFVADNLLTPYHGERMWWMARDLLQTGVLQRWAYISYFTWCWPGQEEQAYNRLKELIVASVPDFQLAAGSRVPLDAPPASSTGSPPQDNAPAFVSAPAGN